MLKRVPGGAAAKCPHLVSYSLPDPLLLLSVNSVSSVVNLRADFFTTEDTEFTEEEEDSGM
jgi:hypothetical protein